MLNKLLWNDGPVPEKASSVRPAINTVHVWLGDIMVGIMNQNMIHDANMKHLKCVKFQSWNESKKQKRWFCQSSALGLNMQVQVCNVEHEVGHVLKWVFCSEASTAERLQALKNESLLLKPPTSAHLKMHT